MTDSLHQRRGRRFIPAVACAVMLLLGGCTTVPAAKPAPVAPAEQPAAGPARAPLDRQNYAKRIKVAVLKAGSAHISVTTRSYGDVRRMKGDIVLSPNPRKLRMRFSSREKKTRSQFLYLRGEVYFTASTLKGNFVKLRGDEARGMKSMTGLPDQLDPLEQLRAQKKAIKTFKVFPDAEKIDGVSVDRILMTLDVKTLLRSNKFLRGLAPGKRATRVFGEVMTCTLYVDEHDVLRRVVMSPMDVTVIADYSAWGKPVSIKKPAASKMLDPSQVIW